MKDIPTNSIDFRTLGTEKKRSFLKRGFKGASDLSKKKIQFEGAKKHGLVAIGRDFLKWRLRESIAIATKLKNKNCRSCCVTFFFFFCNR